jgi:hypothetical protein
MLAAATTVHAFGEVDVAVVATWRTWSGRELKRMPRQSTATAAATPSIAAAQRSGFCEDPARCVAGRVPLLAAIWQHSSALRCTPRQPSLERRAVECDHWPVPPSDGLRAAVGGRALTARAVRYTSSTPGHCSAIEAALFSTEAEPRDARHSLQPPFLFFPAAGLLCVYTVHSTRLPLPLI